jgi:hypothetical protein
MSSIIKAAFVRIIASCLLTYIPFGNSKFRAKHAARPAAVDVARLPETSANRARAPRGTAAACCKGN